MMHKLDRFLKKFHDQGYQAYGVGGCVRDYLLRRPISDYDVTTNALPQQMKELFREYRIIDIGQHYGTIGVFDEGAWFECTTYRRDLEYDDFRHPVSVEFGDKIEDDLIRRDFTMNALAYNQGQILDLVGGIEDINQRRIKTVGNPRERFNEDALRIMRAFRFSAQLGFQIEEDTLSAAYELFPLLIHVSKERLTQEFIKLIEANQLNFVIRHYPDFFEMLLNQKVNLSETESEKFEIRLVELLTSLDLDNLKPFKFSKKQWSNINLLMRVKQDKLTGNELLKSLIHLTELEQNLVFEYLKLTRPNLPLHVTELKINGHDILQCGVAPKFVGNILDELLKAVIDQRVLNEKNELLDYLEKTFCKAESVLK